MKCHQAQQMQCCLAFRACLLALPACMQSNTVPPDGATCISMGGRHQSPAPHAAGALGHAAAAASAAAAPCQATGARRPLRCLLPRLAVLPTPLRAGKRRHDCAQSESCPAACKGGRCRCSMAWSLRRFQAQTQLAQMQQCSTQPTE